MAFYFSNLQFLFERDGNLLMKKLSLIEIQKCSLECLKYFDNVCRKYDLCYSLAYGTLIGAIRHKGFIPWDDDIDVMMPRDDYERLVKVFANEREKSSKFRFICERTDTDYYYSIGRICDTHTKIYFTTNSVDVKGMGVFLDIYPLDFVCESKIILNVFSHIFKIIVYALFLANSKEYIKSNFFVKDIIKFTAWKFFKLTGFMWLFKLQKLLLKICKGSSVYYNVWDNYDYVIPKTFFNELVEVEFEGMKFKSIKQYDIFLKKQYGDYMQLPPEIERVPHHNYNAFYKDDS